MKSDLRLLLDRAQQVLTAQLSADEAEFFDDVLRAQAPKLGDLARAAPAAADYPQAWPMLAQALLRVVGAQQNNNRALADRWAAVAFALTPLVRADYEALR
jgi:hypothetical protein